jgi:polyisoprenoid-binding protein YceI
MKKIIVSTAAIFLLVTASFAQEWNMDKAHSQIMFGIAHMGINTISGNFGTVDAKFTATKDDFSDAVIELTADVNSINTGNEQRNNHLKSDAFFDVAKYGTLTFKSTSFKKMDDKNYQLTGDLTLHGVTKSVVLNATFNGTITNPQSKKTVAGFKVTGSIKRTDFGIATNFPPTMLGDDVMIVANTEFVKS